jgi:hypothetical protein
MFSETCQESQIPGTYLTPLIEKLYDSALCVGFVLGYSGGQVCTRCKM